MNCCLQLYNMIHRLHLKLVQRPRYEKQKNISTDRYQFFVVSLYSELFVSVFPDAVVANVHHVAVVVLRVAHGQPGGPLELAAVGVDHRKERALRQIVDLQRKITINLDICLVQPLISVIVGYRKILHELAKCWDYRIYSSVAL